MVDSPKSPFTGNGFSKFPNFNPSESFPDYYESSGPRKSSSGLRDFSPGTTGTPDTSGERWRPRTQSKSQWMPRLRGDTPVSHGRQKSLSEAIRAIRTRNGSVSQNAHELADALKAPVSPQLVAMCCAWYIVSVISNTSAGVILTTFPKPVTLTTIQFACVTAWCFFVGFIASMFPALKTQIPALRMGIRPPSRELIMTTLPLTGFMIGGHILTSDAMARIPVSLVHTIKGLSPLITVSAYRLVFGVKYNWATYASLVPLTVGVIMACSTKFSDNLLGLISALLSAVLFVTQNIVSKRLFNDAAQAEQEGYRRSHKPDKLNLLCYSSALALCFTFPIWLWSEGFSIMSDIWTTGAITLSSKQEAVDHGRLLFEYLFNGTFHFSQSLVAFQLLSMVSPVTYSVASLIKRVAVICVALLWFGNTISKIQGFGIALTFLGLYLYDRTSDSGKAERKSKALQQQLHQPAGLGLLPLHEKALESPPISRHHAAPPSWIPQHHETGFQPTNMNGSPFPPFSAFADSKKDDAAGPGRPSSGAETNGWLPPGTRAEDTWIKGDAGFVKVS